MESVKERLTKRLSKIPGVTPQDISDWLAEAVAEFDGQDEENETALFYLALYVAYETIASDAARFFRFTDGEESVDKSMIASEYRQLAKEFRAEYNAELAKEAEGHTSNFAVAPRLDRRREA